MNKLISTLKEAFFFKGKVDKPLLAIFLVINSLVLANSILHDPEVGYDAREHLANIRVLPFRLPTVDDSGEYFSPPLPYFLPSLIDKACLIFSEGSKFTETADVCLIIAGKFAQLINFIFSLGITFLFIQIAQQVRAGNRFLKISSLALLGVMTVYYKTFAQVRGEPYVVFFTVVVIYLVAKKIYTCERATWASGIAPGIILGLLALGRQWGFMVFLAIIGWIALVWIFDQKDGARFSQSFIISFLVAFLVAGWFYFYLYTEFGSFSAFSLPPKEFSLSNQPDTFYQRTRLGQFALFKNPVRGNFDNEFFPIFYSETWGDYWGYFVYIKDKYFQEFRGFADRQHLIRYLGQVNAVSVFPSLIFLAGVLTGAFSFLKLFKTDLEEKKRSLFYIFLLLIGIISFLLYMYFLITFPLIPKGDSIKATYMLHALVVLPFLGAEFLEKVRQRKQILYFSAMTILGLVFVHNFLALNTNYRMFFAY